VLGGLLYAPVRFFLDFLRPEESDPRYGGLTFAQWASILFFAAAGYAAFRVLQSGKPADIVAPTSGEAQRKLKLILKEDADKQDEKKKEDKKAPLPEAKAKAKKKSDDDTKDEDDK
jgi:hypothetical protein